MLIAAVKQAPQGAAFDIVLMLHVASFLIAFASVLVTGTQAWRARGGPGARGAESIARYFRPGVNWPGRLLYAVVVFGFVLVAMSSKAYSFSDTFVQLGLVLWIVAVGLAEMVVWPGERKLQDDISGHWTKSSEASRASSADGSSGGDVKQLATRVALSAWTVCAVIICATVIMVDKP